MKAKNVLRFVSLAMLIVAISFLLCALTHPELGTVFYIGGFKIGSAIWKAFYLMYAVVMVALLGISFFVKERK